MLIGRYSAFLDANVLHPGFLRGALLWFADERLLRPVWSSHVLQEWKDSILRARQDIDAAKLDQIQALLTSQFPDAEVKGYEPFIEAITLPDPNDRHVLAAAMFGRCNGIITSNLKDFPSKTVSAFSIEVVHPDQFIVNIIDLDEGRVLGACKRHRASLTKSQPSPDQYLDNFDRCGLIQARQRLQQNRELI